LGFTAASGEPVLCVIIFTSENVDGIPSSWIAGLDITKLTPGLEALEDDEFLREIGEGQVACGGPVCTFRGKRVECLVQASPHGGITGPILTNCLKYMDERELFSRAGGVKPFLLLDGHDSRFHLDFLEYIRDDNHPWIVGFGVPYATHIWQVGDSKEQNGSYKRKESEMKDLLVIEKKRRGLPQVFKSTDIVPIVNFAWKESFARTEGNRNAIFERGWNPCNYFLLTKPEVLRTRGDLQATNDTRSTAINPADVQVNTEVGHAATVLDFLFEQRQNDQAEERRMIRQDEAESTRRILERSKRLTSGSCFARGVVSLNHDSIWEQTRERARQKKVKEHQKHQKDKETAMKRKQLADNIRKRGMETWKLAEINLLLIYKRMKGDPTLKSLNGRDALLQEWEKRKNRLTPPSSPIADENGECVQI
jgi:hypothetical protein